jgi:Tfp pilus assembly protein PilF
LLLDALKRAEQEKLAKQADRPAEPQRARPPAAMAAPTQAPANAASLELAPVAQPHAAGKSDTATAQNVFQAKGAASPRAEAKKNSVLWAAAAAVLIVAAAIGAYVWYSITALRPQITTLRPRAAPTPPPASGEASPPKFEPMLPPVAPARVEPVAAEPKRAPAAVHPAPAQETLAETLLRAPRAAPAPVRLAPTIDKPHVPAEVAAGYDQLREGNLPGARRSYIAALMADAANLDAQLGMATVEARLGNRAAAASHYRRALDVDPRNATALAGLATLAENAQPEALEPQLRADVARYPQSASLRFALGNVYAAQSRWGDAQGEFFEAHRLEPASADIAFNLAVSLDHLGQSRLAADFYRRALDAARVQVAQFDPAAVARRLAELGR